MKHDYWLDKWQANQIGFHQKSYNRLLAKHWPALGIPRDSNVLVPLCGKSLDMLWLANAGYKVIGNELSDLAVQSFFLENRIRFSIDRQNTPFAVYHADSIELWAGDVFDLAKEYLPNIAAVYDRAALVALPTSLRKKYVELQKSLLPKGCVILLVSLEYDPNLINPPPFDIYQTDIENLYSSWCNIEHRETIEANIKGEDGLEVAYRLTVQ